MTEKISGTVKWFSNKKGYGFITPIEGSCITDDIFVHQSAIHSEGYRTLDEDWNVEFEIGHDEDGKPKAENVTAPGGGPCKGPRKSRYGGGSSSRRRRRRAGSGAGAGSSGGSGQDHDNQNGAVGSSATDENQTENGKRGRGGGSSSSSGDRPAAVPKEPQPMWHDILVPEVKEAIQNKQIRTTTGTIDISYHEARIKLGTRNYASLAHEQKILAEGSFDCTSDGLASFEWKRAIQYSVEEGVWNSFLDLSVLVKEVHLADDDVKAVGIGETMHTLMGEGIPDPKSTLIASGFEMRRVVLTTKRR